MFLQYISIAEHASTYHALNHLYGLPCEEALDLLYLLNTANIDSCRECNRRAYYESSFERFAWEIQRLCNPHHTLATLYIALEKLQANIRLKYLTSDQQDAVRALGIVMCDMYERLESRYGDALERLLSDIIRGQAEVKLHEDSHYEKKPCHRARYTRCAG